MCNTHFLPIFASIISYKVCKAFVINISFHALFYISCQYMIFADIKKSPGKSSCPVFGFRNKFWASLFYPKNLWYGSVERVNNTILLILDNPKDLNFHTLHRIQAGINSVSLLCEGELVWKIQNNQLGFRNTSSFKNNNNHYNRMKYIMPIQNYKHHYTILIFVPWLWKIRDFFQKLLCR